MDPISICASAVAFIGFVGRLLDLTINACNLAKILAEVEASYNHARLMLTDSVIMLKRLMKLKRVIVKIGDKELQSLSLDTETLGAYLEATSALYDCLATKKKELSRRSRALRVLFYSLLPSQTQFSDLRHHVERLTQLKDCISLALSTFQTFAGLSTRDTCLETSAYLVRYKAATHEKLDAIVSKQISCNETLNTVRDVGQSASETLALVHSTLEETGAAVNQLSKSTFEEIEGLHLKVSDTVIEAISNSITAFGPAAHHFQPNLPRKWFGVPLPRNRHYFTGREELLTSLCSCLVPNNSIYGLHGLPAIGKTHVAVEFAYRHYVDQGDFTHVFWISADQEEKLEQGFFNIAKCLGLANNMEMGDKDNLVGLARSWLRETPEGLRWLLILDNVDDFKILNPFWADLHNGAVLITSREDSSSTLMAISPLIQTTLLTIFSHEECTELIKKRLNGRVPGSLDDASAAELARYLGHRFPLYMDQVASFIVESDYTLAQFYERCGSAHELQQINPQNPWYDHSVSQAIGDHIMRSLEPRFKTVLKTMAFFDPDEIPEGLLVSKSNRIPILSSPMKCQTVLNHLSRHSFVHPGNRGNTEDRYLVMHRLVRDSALRMDTNTQEAFDNAVHLLRQAFPLHGLARDHMVEFWEECEEYQPHVLALHRRYLKLRDCESLTASYDFLELVYSCAWYLCERGRFEIGKKLIASVYEECQQSIKTTPSMSLFLADIYTVQLYYHNETTQGESLIDIARKAHRIREEAVEVGLLCSSHPNRANGFMNLGVVMAHTDPTRAIKLHSAALEIRLGSDKYSNQQIHGLALNYLNLGRCWWMVKNLSEAAVCFQRSMGLMQSREDATRKKFPLTAWAMSALAIVRADQGCLEPAVYLLSESLKLHRETLGETHMKTLACYYRLAWVCHRVGKLQEAGKLLRAILEKYEDLASQPRAEIARTKFKLAQVLQDLGEETGWVEMREDAIQALREVTDEEVAETPDEEDFDKAIVYFLR